MNLPTITLDFETYYDREYSLSKMQTDEYILDDRFEVIMVGIVGPDENYTCITGSEAEVAHQLQNFCDWSKHAVRCHNTHFDGFIMTQRFGIKPALWKCTLSMARMLYPWLRSHSLANMAKFFHLEDKKTTVKNMLGRTRQSLTTEEFEEYSDYCALDNYLCKTLGEVMEQKVPPLEMYLIDMTIRMFTEPQFVGDTDLLKDLYLKEKRRKEELIAEANLDRDVLMSNNKFAERLRELGVTPPTKISPTTNKETYAFAKTDKQFTALLEHDDTAVAATVAARLGAKTTIAETRLERFVDMSRRGPLAVHLNFWGAKTTGRYSGGNKVNWQNLPARGISAGIRTAIKAPEGRIVLVGDSSNIELRMVMMLAGQMDALAKIEAGVDMYCDFASALFGREITKADYAERFLGKTAMLGLQYGAGAPRFQEMVRIASVGNPAIEPIELDFAYHVVDLYRQRHDRVVELWNHCQHNVLPDIANGCNFLNVDVNGMFVTQNDGFGRPGEPGVVYRDLEFMGDDGWFYTMAGKPVRIYGPKVVENLCQHAAMKVVMWQTARINRKFPVKLSVHDEAVCLPLIEEADEAKAYMEECLRLTPKWCRGKLPVDCEVEVGGSYGDAK